MDMSPNIGKVDKFFRYVIGIVLLSLIVLLDGPARYWGILGLFPLATAIMDFCPLWYKLGINTRGHPPTTHHPAH